MKDRIAAPSFGAIEAEEPQLGSGQWFKESSRRDGGTTDDCLYLLCFEHDM